MKEKSGVLSRQTAFLDLFYLSSTTHASPPALLDAGDDDDRYDPFTIQQVVTPAEIIVALSVFMLFL